MRNSSNVTINNWDINERVELANEAVNARLGTNVTPALGAICSNYILDAELGNQNGKLYGLTIAQLETGNCPDEHEALALHEAIMEYLEGPITIN